MVFCKEQSLDGLSRAPQKPEQMLSWWQGDPESWLEIWGAMGGSLSACPVLGRRQR